MSVSTEIYQNIKVQETSYYKYKSLQLTKKYFSWWTFVILYSNKGLFKKEMKSIEWSLIESSGLHNEKSIFFKQINEKNS